MNIPGLTEEQVQQAKDTLRAFDEAMESQPKGASDAKLIVMANYGDLAAGFLKAILAAAEDKCLLLIHTSPNDDMLKAGARGLTKCNTGTDGALRVWQEMLAVIVGCPACKGSGEGDAGDCACAECGGTGLRNRSINPVN